MNDFGERWRPMGPLDLFMGWTLTQWEQAFEFLTMIEKRSIGFDAWYEVRCAAGGQREHLNNVLVARECWRRHRSGSPPGIRVVESATRPERLA